MHIQLPVNDSCAFCDYLDGRRPYTVLWRDPNVAVFVTREQRGVNHLLVLPQCHYATLLEIPDSVARELMIAVRDAALSISRTNETRGISVWQNNGISAHQTIAHMHFHVAGTLDNGGTNFGDVPELPVSSTDLIALKLASEVPLRSDRIVFQSSEGFA